MGFDFMGDVMRMENLKMFQAWTILFSALNMLVLLPIWILMLGKQLTWVKPVHYDMAPSSTSSRRNIGHSEKDTDEYNSSQRELLHRNNGHSHESDDRSN